MNIELIFGDFPRLESTNLQLKKIKEEHVQELFNIYDNTNVFHYCGIIPKHNFNTVNKMIGHFERDFQKRKRVKWGIFEKSQSEKLVGIIECMEINQKVNSVSIGYFLAEDYWGRGIATEAVRMVIHYLLQEVQVNRIQAEVMPANESSKQVLIKNGFLKEGLLRQATLWSGKGVIDLEIYSILKEDYR
ncbi:GNAT family protein [Bacillus spongiae]|uniref:GNAT family protein n=1 Tax=Bacillus spongiae TaxID=2683610 RepID=A0ABU8HJK0_9BACI